MASVARKNGGVPKEALGLADAEKIRPGTYESMCHPISQAELLNRAGCQLNVVFGLCVGHDSLFFKHSDGLATTLVAKRRAPARRHLLRSRVWGPDRPAKLPAQPAEGRRD